MTSAISRSSLKADNGTTTVIPPVVANLPRDVESTSSRGPRVYSLRKRWKKAHWRQTP